MEEGVSISIDLNSPKDLCKKEASMYHTCVLGFLCLLWAGKMVLQAQATL